MESELNCGSSDRSSVRVHSLLKLTILTLPLWSMTGDQRHLNMTLDVAEGLNNRIQTDLLSLYTQTYL